MHNRSSLRKNATNIKSEKKRKSNYKKKRKNLFRTKSFLYIYLQVSIVVLLLWWFVYFTYIHLFSSIQHNDDNNDNDNISQHIQRQFIKHPPSNTLMRHHDLSQNHSNPGKSSQNKSQNPNHDKIESPPVIIPYPPPDDPRSKYDAYGIASLFPSLLCNHSCSNSSFSSSYSKCDICPFLHVAKTLRSEFSSLYGGENSARALLLRGISTFDVFSNITIHPKPAQTQPNKVPLSFTSSSSSSSSSILSIQSRVKQTKQFHIPSHLLHTAMRILHTLPNLQFHPKSIQHMNHPFRIAFGGYSVTVGRGNYFHQSYPFVLQRLLNRTMESLGLTQNHLDIRNAAIGGVPSFPYGWCMTNFWGGKSHHHDFHNIDTDTHNESDTEIDTDTHNEKNEKVIQQYADVVSWDYSMNEAGGQSEGLESYLRRVITYRDHSCFKSNSNHLSHKIGYGNESNHICKGIPMIIIKDTHMATERKKVVQRYVKEGHLIDPLIIHTDPAIEPFLSITSKNALPLGFRDWRKFGSPPGAPGQSSHHPGVKEHQLIGWMLTMYFLSALELIAYLYYFLIDENDLDLKKNESNIWEELFTSLESNIQSKNGLPPPISNLNATDTSLISILFGSKKNVSVDNSWTMNPIHCATTFEPILQSDLTSFVVSGTTAENLHWNTVRGPLTYREGWVLDWSVKERTAKRKLARYGGLGFVDSKKAYYGIKASGKLKIFLPILQAKNLKKMKDDSFYDVRRYIQSLVVCEVNEIRGNDECILAQDASFSVGGKLAHDVKMIKAVGVEYLGKNICANVGIPKGAVISKNVKNSPQSLHNDDNENYKEEFGLMIEIEVVNPKVTLKNGACSVSHIIWEET